MSSSSGTSHLRKSTNSMGSTSTSTGSLVSGAGNGSGTTIATIDMSSISPLSAAFDTSFLASQGVQFYSNANNSESNSNSNNSNNLTEDDEEVLLSSSSMDIASENGTSSLQLTNSLPSSLNNGILNTSGLSTSSLR